MVCRINAGGHGVDARFQSALLDDDEFVVRVAYVVQEHDHVAVAHNDVAGIQLGARGERCELVGLGEHARVPVANAAGVHAEEAYRDH